MPPRMAFFPPLLIEAGFTRSLCDSAADHPLPWSWALQRHYTATDGSPPASSSFHRVPEHRSVNHIRVCNKPVKCFALVNIIRMTGKLLNDLWCVMGTYILTRCLLVVTGAAMVVNCDATPSTTFFRKQNFFFSATKLLSIKNCPNVTMKSSRHYVIDKMRCMNKSLNIFSPLHSFSHYLQELNINHSSCHWNIKMAMWNE